MFLFLKLDVACFSVSLPHMKVMFLIISVSILLSLSNVKDSSYSLFFFSKDNQWEKVWKAFPQWPFLSSPGNSGKTSTCSPSELLYLVLVCRREQLQLRSFPLPLFLLFFLPLPWQGGLVEICVWKPWRLRESLLCLWLPEPGHSLSNHLTLSTLPFATDTIAITEYPKTLSHNKYKVLLSVVEVWKLKILVLITLMAICVLSHCSHVLILEISDDSKQTGKETHVVSSYSNE